MIFQNRASIAQQSRKDFSNDKIAPTPLRADNRGSQRARQNCAVYAGGIKFTKYSI